MSTTEHTEGFSKTELSGRFDRRREAWWICTAGSVICALLVLWPLGRGTGRLSPAAVVTLTALVVVLLYVALVRSWGFRVARRHPAEDETSTGVDGAAEDRPDLVICCSGGGIKSASFSLGALSELGLDRRIDEANAVVGVSGGGYAAAAYTVARQRARAAPAATAADREAALRRIFAAGSPELGRLRRRTNYLYTPRAASELVLNLLLGWAANVTMTLAIVGAYAWLLADFAVASGVHAESCVGQTCTPVPFAVDRAWGIGPGEPAWRDLWLPGAVPLAVVVVLYLVDRAMSLRPGRPGPLSSRGANVWWARLPVSLAFLAVSWWLLVPGLLWLAVQVHTVWQTQAGSWAEASALVRSIVATALASTWFGVVRSTVKGLQQQQRAGTDDPLVVRVRQTARTYLAPAAGLFILAAAVLLVSAGLVAYDLTDGAAWGSSTWWVPAVALGVLVLLGILVDPNRSSLHVFYRDRLAHAYLDDGGADDRSQVFFLPFTCVAGEPELVLCGTLNLQDEDQVPTGRAAKPFVMSADLMGVPPTDPAAPHVNAGNYRRPRWPGLTVPTAVAVSGAAIAPLSGREVRVRPYRILLTAANIRLGLWVPNPDWRSPDRPPTGLSGPERLALRLDAVTQRLSGLQIWQEAFVRVSCYAPYVYVTDGGHYDNLGLVEALRRRPRHIIVVDGSGDTEDQFPTMGNAIATARMTGDLEVDFEPGPMVRGKRPYPRTSSVTAKAKWPAPGGTGEETCVVHYLKCVMPDDVSWAVKAFALAHEGFPSQTASVEAYDELEFEAFRRLGVETVRRAALPVSFRTPQEDGSGQ